MIINPKYLAASAAGTNNLAKGSPVDYSRRRFVQGVAAGSSLLATGLGTSVMAAANGTPQQQVLSGNQFKLAFDYQPVNFTGKDRLATAINGSVPAPVLRWKQGERVTLDVTNNMAVDSSIHWHGLILPSGMDGVPHISENFSGIKPGDRFRYQFDVNQSGTYWYHSHSGFQEQTGAYGAIIIDPAEPPPYSYDREHVIMLSDWSDEDPEDIYAKLKKMSHIYNTRERTTGDLWSEIQRNGLSQTWNDREMWNEMRMSDRDISDVTGSTYTLLMNGQTPADNWTGMFNKGERVLLRIINASAMTLFDFRIPGLKMTVVAADGQYVEPISVDEFRIGVAETYDVLVEPRDDTAYAIFAQAIDRSGYAIGRLTADSSLQAEVPSMDTAPLLTHGDMGMGGMDHSNMDHSNMSAEMMAMMMGDGIKHADTEYVLECTDDKSLKKAERKRLQIANAPKKSADAKQIKIADKTCNLKSIMVDPPEGWSISRQLEYFQWAQQVYDGLKGVNPCLDAEIEQILTTGLKSLSEQQIAK